MLERQAPHQLRHLPTLFPLPQSTLNHLSYPGQLCRGQQGSLEPWQTPASVTARAARKALALAGHVSWEGGPTVPAEGGPASVANPVLSGWLNFLCEYQFPC